MEVEMWSSASGALPTARVRRILSGAAGALGEKSRDVSVFFCGDRRMAGLNRYATRQARRRGESPSREMDRLLLHGYLHLLGYDHETDQGEMEALEEKLRRRLGIAERTR